MIAKIKNLTTELMLLSVVIIWGANYTFGKYGMSEFSPALFNALRFLIAGPLLLLGTYISEKSIKIARADLVRLFFVSMVGIAFYQPLFYMSVKYTSATNASLLIALSPIFTGFFAVISRQEKFTWRMQIGSLVALSGAMLVILTKSGLSMKYPQAMLGNLTGILAAILWGLYPVLANPLLKKYSSLRVTAWSSLLGLLVLVPMSLNDFASIANGYSSAALMSLIYSAFFITIYGLVAWYVGVGKIGTVNVMVYMYLIPLVAVIVASLVIKEPVNLWQVLGGFIIIFGLTIVKKTDKPSELVIAKFVDK